MRDVAQANAVRKARRYHRHLRRKDPSLAAAVASGGMTMPDGTVVLPLVDGDIALYEIGAVVEYRCRPARSRGPVIEMALEKIIEFENCVRAAEAKSNLVHLVIAAQ
jgi:hypothetical protein